MKLKAKQTPYSSVVGGGLTLIDEHGRPRFMVMICGTTNGITKEETATIANALSSGIPTDGIELAERS